MSASDLQSLNCPNCGAALTGEAHPGATLRCEFCGTPVRVPASSAVAKPEPAITISAEGNLNIGEFVGGDKMVAQQTTASNAPLPDPLPLIPPRAAARARRRRWVIGVVSVGCALCVIASLACSAVNWLILSYR